jgi:2-iminobutanoate/2-iminopropanoate deaminase
MPITKCNPDVVHPPAGNYSHLAVVPPGHRLLYLAGQLGMHKDGTVPNAVEDQFEQALQNILQIVTSQGGSAEDVAKLTFFYAEEPSDRGRHGKALRAMFGEYRPAMTFIRVLGLADPRYKVEVEAIAAVQ